MRAEFWIRFCNSIQYKNDRIYHISLNKIWIQTQKWESRVKCKSTSKIHTTFCSHFLHTVAAPPQTGLLLVGVFCRLVLRAMICKLKFKFILQTSGQSAEAIKELIMKYWLGSLCEIGRLFYENLNFQHLDKDINEYYFNLMKKSYKNFGVRVYSPLYLLICVIYIIANGRKMAMAMAMTWQWQWQW